MGIRDPLASLQESGKLCDNTQSKRHGEEKIRGGKLCVAFIFLPACNGRIDATQSGTNLNDNNPPASLTKEKIRKKKSRLVSNEIDESLIGHGTPLDQFVDVIENGGPWDTSVCVSAVFRRRY
jgi:hypothetical protein